MKICLLRRHYSRTGGAERFTQRLARMLHENGHTVSIAAESWPESEDGSYRIEKIRSRDPVSFARACLRSVVGQRGTLIFSLERTFRQHVFRAGDGLHACWLERRARHQTGLKRFWSALSRKHRAVLELEKRVFLPGATGWILANSPLVRSEIEERFRFPRERIRVIPPGVDTQIFHPCLDRDRRAELRRMLGVPQDAIVWCFVGSGFERKGLKWAVSIAALQRHPPVWLLVLGKGGRSRYLRLAERYRFAKRLRFVPENTPALHAYHASDAFILPTLYDPCSNASLEAAACGLPVITTTGNGAAEWTPGIALEDPSRIEECAERCAPFAHPLLPSKLEEAVRIRLDEKPCWEATLKLAEEAIQQTF